MRIISSTWCVLLLLLLAIAVTASHEPRFHVRPPANWVNDPNGPYRDPVTKQMHLYMQYNPQGSVWGSINWYHFTSMDYVKWQDQGIALKNNNEYDRRGAYSGSITQGADGTPVVMYTCAADGDVQRQCIALPPKEDVQSDGKRSLNSFVKLPTNPVLTEKDVPGLVGLNHFRDPTNFWVNPDNASEWLVAFVASVNNSAGVPEAQVVVFATSDPNFRSDFRFSHAIWENSFEFDNMLECPDFFKLGDEYFLKVSTMISGQDYWVYGYYMKNPDDKTVYFEDPARSRTYVDYGRWYASKQNYDPILNRIILWGWIPEEDTEAAMKTRGWSGAMDMPRNVEYDEIAEKLKTYPMPELAKLRLSNTTSDVEIRANEVKVYNANAPLHYEMVVDFVIPEGFTNKPADNTDTVPSFGVLVRYKDSNTYTRFAVTMPPTANMGAGFDQKGRVLAVHEYGDQESCALHCQDDRRCVAWTTVNVTEDPAVWRCTLMSTYGDVVAANNSATTGRVWEPSLLLDRGKSGTTGFHETWTGRAPLVGNGTRVQLRVFVDDTIVQVFKDGGLESLTGRVYVPRDYSGVALFSYNINATLSARVSFYEMDTVHESNGDAAWHTAGSHLIKVMLLAVTLHTVLPLLLF
ncbi:beta-fructofuranosidase-like protein [Trypanosoma theileri]|uniref:Beta-fructofuranosidase-like protein n=1 Tax=Trypanosoma theileri TaxID=67003 RepID=A0A1X0NY19_9TRYP|nr:beta-fructofuranosidase-like protein [Trypanosoma theileri]ORC89567.1 beta-fructofuranosidase-like protein [Trypanosoma theileri]